MFYTDPRGHNETNGGGPGGHTETNGGGPGGHTETNGGGPGGHTETNGGGPWGHSETNGGGPECTGGDIRPKAIGTNSTEVNYIYKIQMFLKLIYIYIYIYICKILVCCILVYIQQKYKKKKVNRASWNLAILCSFLLQIVSAKIKTETATETADRETYLNKVLK